MNIKRIITAGLAGIACLWTVAAVSQATLFPFITGTNTENRRQVFDIGMLRINNSNGSLTAFAGGGQANGTLLTYGLNRFTTVATAGDSATLPVLSGGVMITVINATANSMNIFGATGQTINGGAANAAFALPAGKTVTIFQAVDGAWFCNLSA